MLRTASIKLKPEHKQSKMLHALLAEYTSACNKLVPVVCENRLWNKVKLHQLTYYMLRETTKLGSQMVCNAIDKVCKAYKAQKARGRISKGAPVHKIKFTGHSV